MKRYKKIVIGGIENKVFNLILITVLLLTVLYMAVSLHHSKMLETLTAESDERQQAAITQITETVLDKGVEQTLERSNRTEARIAEAMLEAAEDRVTWLAACATGLFAAPQDYSPRPYAGPDPADDGTWTAKVIYADGVDASDPAVASKVGLLANLFDMMIALCPAYDAANVYIAIPEGAHLSVSDTSGSWFTDGKLRSYDPRSRNWYQKAVEAGEPVFTEGEWDANTGAYCIECAAPVYGPDGELAAVVGTDLYLNEMQEALRESVLEGECNLLINQSGRAVLAPQAEAFPMPEADREGDIRASSNAFLSQTVRASLEGSDGGVTLGELTDGMYYIAATPIQKAGWVLISAYSQESAEQLGTLLNDSYEQIQSEAVTAYRSGTGQSRRITLILFIAVTLLTLVGALVLGKRIVRPLNTMTRHIATQREGDFAFDMVDAYRTGDEVEELAQSFAALSRRMRMYVEEVRQVTAEKERIGTELSLAKDIQNAMLPHIFPPFPERTDIDVFASMDPAKEVGGDFYDYFLIDDDHLCVMIADVSGKGVPAALFMMASKIILQSVAMLGRSPAEILARTNEAICANNDAQMFITVWLGILELSTGRMKAANAGHEYPAIRRPGGAFELYRDSHGFVIGGLEGMHYREYEIQFEPGTMLFVYTDGLPEATDADKEAFGSQRVLDALNTSPGAAPREILQHVNETVEAFVEDAEQFDDLTMLCMEYRGPQTRPVAASDRSRRDNSNPPA